MVRLKSRPIVYSRIYWKMRENTRLIMDIPKLELLKSQKQECELFERYVKKKASSGVN